MKYLFPLAIWFVTLFPTRINAQHMGPVDIESSVQFSIKNFGFSTSGSFKGLAGKIYFDASNLSRAAFDVSVAAGSIETGNHSRDRHLKSDDYFDVDHYPSITIKSETITRGRQIGSFILHGTLTIKGIINKIDIPFEAKPLGSGYVFEAEFPVNRIDFKVGGNSISLSDNAMVTLKVVAR